MKFNVSHDDRAVATIEFAIAAPLIILFVMSCADMLSYMMAHQKMSRAAYTVSNLLTQLNEGATEGQISDIALSTNEVASPFNFTSNGRAMMTAIIGTGEDGEQPTGYEVAWQRCYGNHSVKNSEFGPTGTSIYTGDANGQIPEDSITLTSQILVVTEIAYNFEPLFGLIELGPEIHYTSHFRPRLGSIEMIVSDGSTPLGC